MARAKTARLGWSGPVLRRLVLSMGAGLLTTVAVAWGLSATSWATRVDDQPRGSTFRDRRSDAGEGLGRLIVEWREAPGVVRYHARLYPTCVSTYTPDPRSPEEAVPDWAAAAVLPWCAGRRPWPGAAGCDDTAPSAQSTSVEAAGWPFHALWRDCRADTGSETGVGIAVARGVASMLAPGRELPHRPIWPGLVANTAILGCAWWIFTLVPGLASRALRICHARCPGCGYPLHGLPPVDSGHVRCPECGSVRARPRSTPRGGVMCPAT